MAYCETYKPFPDDLTHFGYVVVSKSLLDKKLSGLDEVLSTIDIYMKVIDNYRKEITFYGESKWFYTKGLKKINDYDFDILPQYTVFFRQDHLGRVKWMWWPVKDI